MRAALLAATMACGLATGARAAVFDLTGQTYNAVAQSLGAVAQFDLVISDAAVARGSFNLQESSASGRVFVTGDVADFVSASIGETVTPTFDLGANVNLALTFANGTPSGSISFAGVLTQLFLTGSGGTFSGVFGSDLNRCQSQGSGACGVTGQIAAAANPVPEPASAALLGLGVAAVGMLRRSSRYG